MHNGQSRIFTSITMIHLGIFLLVFAYVSFRFITEFDRFKLLSIRSGYSLFSAYVLGMVFLMLFSEVVFWGTYIIYHWITD